MLKAFHQESEHKFDMLLQGNPNEGNHGYCHRHEMCSNKSTRRVTCVVEFCLIGVDNFLVIRRSRAQKKWFPL